MNIFNVPHQKSHVLFEQEKVHVKERVEQLLRVGKGQEELPAYKNLQRLLYCLMSNGCILYVPHEGKGLTIQDWMPKPLLVTCRQASLVEGAPRWEYFFEAASTGIKDAHNHEVFMSPEGDYFITCRKKALKPEFNELILMRPYLTYI